jgi:cytochrome b6-f complex iron-sulfur subunit
MKRRRFLSVVVAVLGTAAFGSFAYPLARFLAPPSRESRDKQLQIKKSDIRSGDAKEIVFNGKPMLIINRPEKGYVAFSRVCTHLGCLIEYDKGRRRLVCPCHAGTFDLEGNVLSGPPPRPLSAVSLRVEGEFIILS